MDLTYRLVKGSPLTFKEGDDNLRELSGSIAILAVSSSAGGGTYTNSTPTLTNFPNDDNPSIPAGSTFVSKSFQEMMELMLYPTLNPTLTAPSSTFSISPSGFQEIGDVINITLNATFSKGSISPAYAGGPSERSGDPVEYRYTGTGTSNIVSNQSANQQTVSSYTVLINDQSWTSAVSHSAGEQPLDSDGNAYDNPYPDGLTPTITRKITGVYPVYATSVSINTLTKQSLQSMSTDIVVTVVAEDNTNKHTIDIPIAFGSITKVQLLNTVSGQFEGDLLNDFSSNSITKNVNAGATGVPYQRFTHNGAKVGERTYKFIV